MFTDDLLLFCKGNTNSINLMLDAVDEFSGISGLKTNHSKCSLFPSNVHLVVIQSSLARSRFTWANLPIKFLVLPLICSRLNASLCQPLLDNLCFRVLHWTTRFISQAGTLELVRSVLFVVQSFWIMYIFLPKCVLKKFNLSWLILFWGGSNDRCMHKVAWLDVCLPKSEGGLNLKNLEDWHDSAILFQLWRIISQKFDSLWIRWVKNSFLKSRFFWTMRIPQHCPWS